MAICTNIELLETVNVDTQILRVTLDGSTSALMVYDLAEAMKYLNKDVEVTYRKDIWNGNICDFINTLTEHAVVNTFERDANVKLFTKTKDNHSNVCFADIEQGTTAVNSVVFCTDISFNSSARATWADLKILDSTRRVSSVRLFDPDTKAPSFKNTYIRCDLRRNEYGFSTDAIYPAGSDFAINPEVNIAERYIIETFKDNAPMVDFIRAIRLFDHMRAYAEYEPGFITVRTAIELDIAHNLKNVMWEANIDAVMQAIVLSKCFTTEPSSVFSPEMRNFIVASRAKLPHMQETRLLLDETNTDNSPERKLYKQVKKLADEIVKVRKGEWNA